MTDASGNATVMTAYVLIKSATVGQFKPNQKEMKIPTADQPNAIVINNFSWSVSRDSTKGNYSSDLYADRFSFDLPWTSMCIQFINACAISDPVTDFTLIITGQNKGEAPGTHAVAGTYKFKNVAIQGAAMVVAENNAMCHVSCTHGGWDIKHDPKANNEPGSELVAHIMNLLKV
jgi:hypothetical protein